MQVKANLRSADQSLKMMELARDLTLDDARANIQFLLNTSAPQDRELINDLTQADRKGKKNLATKLKMGLIVYTTICASLVLGYFIS